MFRNAFTGFYFRGVRKIAKSDEYVDVCLSGIYYYRLKTQHIMSTMR